MKFTKKVFAAVVSVILVLAGCAQNNDSNNNAYIDSPSSEYNISSNEGVTSVQPEPNEESSLISNVSSNTVSTHEHSYSAATCTSAERCSCGSTRGSALGHAYTDATCTALAKCQRCGETKGNLLNHSYSSGKCVTCGQEDPNKIPDSTKQSIISNLDQAISDLKLSKQAYGDYLTSPALNDIFFNTAITYAKRAENYTGIARVFATSYPKATLSDGKYIVDGLATLEQTIIMLTISPSDENYTKVIDFAEQIRSQLI